jgi:hypothetical protein
MILHRFFSQFSLLILHFFNFFHRQMAPMLCRVAVFLLGTVSVHSAGTAIKQGASGADYSANQSLDLRGQSMEKGDIGALFISGKDVDLVIEGQKSNDNKINLNTNATTQLGKKKTSLKLLGPDHQKLHGKILVPSGMRIVIEGGSVHLTIQGFEGELSVAAGTAGISGQGKLSRFTLVAGDSAVKLNGLMGQTQVHCGKGDIRVGFIRESYEHINDLVIPTENNESGENKYISSGLRLHYPAIKININLASGHAILFFPKDLGVYYPKESQNLKSLFVPHQSKRAPYRIFPYISGAASLTLRNDANGAGVVD